jgi:hypothetical protein
MGERMYRSTLSWPRHYVEVSFVPQPLHPRGKGQLLQSWTVCSPHAKVYYILKTEGGWEKQGKKISSFVIERRIRDHILKCERKHLKE